MLPLTCTAEGNLHRIVVVMVQEKGYRAILQNTVSASPGFQSRSNVRQRGYRKATSKKPDERQLDRR